jgi:predicted nucleic acid-binding protein
MIVIIDANVLISAIINPEGKISKLLVLSKEIEFILPQYALLEIEGHKSKICAAYKIPNSFFDKTLLKLSSYFLVFSEKEINTVFFGKALEITKNVDENDAIYVAFTLALDALLWTGDLKLYRALRRKIFKQIITTKELEEIIKGLQ